MPKYLIEMPEGWVNGSCKKCNPHWACHEKYQINEECPLSYAKEAVEIKPENHAIVGSCYGVTRVDGQPVKLFAVRDK